MEKRIKRPQVRNVCQQNVAHGCKAFFACAIFCRVAGEAENKTMKKEPGQMTDGKEMIQTYRRHKNKKEVK